MKLITVITSLIICLLVSTFFAADVHALSKLGKNIQKELDVNPFLKKEGIKLRVVDEEAGYVTVEMYEGSREIREQINDDVNSLMSWANLKASDADKKVVFVIARALSIIDEMEGVKDIMLTSAVNTPADQEESVKKGIALYNQGKYSAAKTWLEKPANQGYAKAQNQLGVMYKNGQGVSKDPEKAFEWFQKAANLGDADAITWVGILYYKGSGTETNYDKAFEWFQKAGELGHAGAISWVGSLYYSGLGTEQNYDKALEWFQKAADLGNINSMLRIGNMSLYGLGNPQNSTRAIEWYEKAAELGNALALTSVGLCYMEGKGIEQSYTEAIEWFNKAIDKNDVYANSVAYANLAWIYATSKDEYFLDGKKALDYASRVGTEKLYFRMMASKAAAYARNGRFNEAIHYQEQSINSLKDYQKPVYEKKYNHILELYYNKQPYTEEFKFK